MCPLQLGVENMRCARPAVNWQALWSLAGPAAVPLERMACMICRARKARCASCQWWWPTAAATLRAQARWARPWAGLPGVGGGGGRQLALPFPVVGGGNTGASGAMVQGTALPWLFARALAHVDKCQQSQTCVRKNTWCQSNCGRASAARATGGGVKRPPRG